MFFLKKIRKSVNLLLIAAPLLHIQAIHFRIYKSLLVQLNLNNLSQPLSLAALVKGMMIYPRKEKNTISKIYCVKITF